MRVREGKKKKKKRSVFFFFFVWDVTYRIKFCGNEAPVALSTTRGKSGTFPDELKSVVVNDASAPLVPAGNDDASDDADGDGDDDGDDDDDAVAVVDCAVLCAISWPSAATRTIAFIVLFKRRTKKKKNKRKESFSFALEIRDQRCERFCNLNHSILIPILKLNLNPQLCASSRCGDGNFSITPRQRLPNEAANHARRVRRVAGR